MSPPKTERAGPRGSNAAGSVNQLGKGQVRSKDNIHGRRQRQSAGAKFNLKAQRIAAEVILANPAAHIPALIDWARLFLSRQGVQS